MRRFAKLTRAGAPCYVDPELVGVVARDPLSPGGFTVLMSRGNVGAILADMIQEKPDEAYRRLAAAGQVVTKEDVQGAVDALDTALAGFVDRARSGLWYAPTEADARHSIDMALQPFREAVKVLNHTVLRALYTSAGEEPPDV